MFSALLFAAAPATGARAVDCSTATGGLERQICGDPVMIDYDRRIAAAYGRALAIWDGAIAPYVRRDQQRWMVGFQTIERLDGAIETQCVLSDNDCVRDEMRRRVEDVESGAYVHSGVYRSPSGMKLLLHPGLAAGYRVRVYDPARAAKVNLLTAADARAALREGTDEMISAMGDANGLPLPATDGCVLRLLPQPLAIRVVQTGACRGQAFDGVYSRLLDETLQSYELELH
ncbi:lysozyme inhibitor LprI family protein [Rhizorhabdus dicambivorans]|uniref:DUF1311 domain-containing protein n=1 Tax=Rhizorhabdus dicambivorans TaxID=1850238 RepID=A0A2A4FNQ7_9SPHN|nr:hypothetical protein [Rhizorhabdus dicambivorans]ATE64788.1 hypothetical protein CMV14_10585 [Rhizorhabdus dicambivorans]PCE39729.1 hypothetical protein COO09_23985 [Rhizorhabdus dicambivorans]